MSNRHKDVKGSKEVGGLSYCREGGPMANIQVKGINDYLLFIVNDEVDEAICLDELRGLLSSPSFQKKNFYVKGYFDLGKRQLTKELFEQLLHILNQTRNVLFCGTQKVEVPKPKLTHFNGIIRSGQTFKSHEDLLFEGQINPGGTLIVHGRVFMLGTCFGTIEVFGKGACISASDLRDACLIINDKRQENVSVRQLTIFNDSEDTMIHTREVEKLWQEQ